jgi:hypothetical protein
VLPGAAGWGEDDDPEWFRAIPEDRAAGGGEIARVEPRDSTELPD